MKILLAILILVASSFGQVTHVFPATDTDNTFTGSNRFNKSVVLGEVTCTAGASGIAILCSDSTHQLLKNLNGAGFLKVVGIASAAVAGDCAKFAANGIDLVDSGAAGCGAGNPAGLDKQFQFNDGGSAFGGASAKNGTTQATYNKTTGQASLPNLEAIRFADASYNWSQSPVADLTTPGSGKTITLTPCPLGVDVSNNANAQYAVYIATVGTAEAVPVTGGTCTSGGASGTIIVTTANVHAAGYTVGSASTGMQEAHNDGCANSFGGNCQVQLLPAASSTPNYTIFATVYLHGSATGNSGKVHLLGNGAYINCATRDVCIFNGSRSHAGNYNVIEGLRFKTDLQIDGAKISGASAAGGTYTITTSAVHPYATNDYVDVEFYSPNGSVHTVQKVTVTDTTHFTFVLGSATFSNTAPTFGWSNIENAAIEDNAQGSVLRDIDFAGLTAAGGNANGFSYGIIVDDDENANIQHMTNSNGGLRCTGNFCGAYVFVRGDGNNAGIVHLSDFDITGQCAGNGVLVLAGNSSTVRDGVIQGYNQYGVNYPGGLQGITVSNLYEEVGSCLNPHYPGSLLGMAGLFGQQFTVLGDDPIVGQIPLFANTGANQRNYFIVPRSTSGTTFGYGPILLAGYATTNNAGTVNVYWPQVVNDGNAGTILYDVLLVTGTNSVPPYVGSANSLAVGSSGSCTDGICTFADTHAATTPYTVNIQTWFPHLYFWPGSYVGTDSVNRDTSFGVNLAFRVQNFSTTGVSGTASSFGARIPYIIAGTCRGSQGTYSPSWVQCNNGPAASGATTATLYQGVGGNGTGFPVGLKGKLNFGPEGGFPTHLLTLRDSAFEKTKATVGSRPTADANDTYLGNDQAGGLMQGAETSISRYLGNTGDNANWLERLTSSLDTFKVPITTNSQVTSTLAIGTAPLVVASTTAVANLTVSNHPLSSACVATANNGTCTAFSAVTAAKIVYGDVTLATGSSTLAGLPFTSSSTYRCAASDVTGANAIKIAYNSGAQITVTGTGSDVISVVCAGN